jgi:ADP-ribose pyrophosphatase
MNNTTRPTWKTLSESIALQTPWFRIRHTKYVAPSGRDADYYVHEGDDSVLCVCVNKENKFLVVEQYRVPVGKVALDYPAGHIDPTDPSPEIAALREVEQETGYRPGSINKLAVIDKDPGFSSCKIHIFLVRDLKPGTKQFDHTEDIKYKYLTADEIKKCLRESRLSCAFCVSATLFAFRELNIPL